MKLKMSLDPGSCPRSVLVCERSSFLDPRNRISSQLQHFHVNHKVSLLLPGCSSAPSHLETAMKSFNSFYLIRNLPIYGLLDRDFLQSAVYQGSVYGLSYRTRIDEDNCVALLPNGRLVLSLDKDSFQVLGFDGKASKFNHKTSKRFVVSVDLTDSSMRPGGRGYERLLTGLTSRLPMTLDFLLSHHPGGGASLQPLLSSYDWTEHRPEISQRVLTQLSCPDLLTSDPLTSDPLTSDLLTSDPHSFLEWLGAVDADISCENSSSSFLSSLLCPDPQTRLSEALSVSVRGPLVPQDLVQLVQELRSHLERPGAGPWAAMTVHGFADSPVSWGGAEHGVLMGGDNFYTLLLFPDHSYRLYLATGAYDTCP